MGETCSISGSFTKRMRPTEMLVAGSPTGTTVSPTKPPMCLILRTMAEWMRTGHQILSDISLKL